MRGIVKAFRRPPAVRPRDRNGGFPRLSDGVAQGLRCPASPRHALLAENLGKPSLWVIINETWYEAAGRAGPARVATARSGPPGGGQRTTRLECRDATPRESAQGLLDSAAGLAVPVVDIQVADQLVVAPVQTHAHGSVAGPAP